MIWHIAVHPDFRRKGIAHQLLCEAENRVKKLGINYLEARTHDDVWINKWYLAIYFEKEIGTNVGDNRTQGYKYVKTLN
ncbi:GNAT family N-acetyltransferase [Priestia megaterium]